MYVAPDHRGTGVAAKVLHELEAVAESLAIKRLVLETGDRIPAATALYRRAGFEVIPCFSDYASSPLSVRMAKDIGQ